MPRNYVPCPNPHACGTTRHIAGTAAHQQCVAGQARGRFGRAPVTVAPGRQPGTLDEVESVHLRPGVNVTRTRVTGSVSSHMGGEISDSHCMGDVMLMQGASAVRVRADKDIHATHGGRVKDCSSERSIILMDMSTGVFTEDAAPGQVILIGSADESVGRAMANTPQSELLDMHDETVMLVTRSRERLPLLHSLRPFVARDKTDPLWVNATNGELIDHLESSEGLSGDPLEDSAVESALILFPNPEV